MQNSIKNRRKRKKHRLKINQKSPQKQEASTQNRRKIGCGKKYGWHYIQFWFARGARSMHQTVSYIMSYIIIYQISYIISIIYHIISYHISYIDSKPAKNRLWKKVWLALYSILIRAWRKKHASNRIIYHVIYYYISNIIYHFYHISYHIISYIIYIIYAF